MSAETRPIPSVDESCIIKRRRLAENQLHDIKLNATETQINDLLLDFCRSEPIRSQYPDIVVRFTGGWVRDKLLGRESNDIDVAISSMTGLDFAQGLSEFMAANMSRYNWKPRSIHKIDKNPEKSKHLETATTKIYGLDIDFVNLRNEEFANEDDIPTSLEFGSPREDALRRDATLNALFYNLQEAKVEDFTGMGISDLENRLLRTPLPPVETFHDDPLRALRIIRFATRYEFDIVPECQLAIGSPGVIEALTSRISRERISVEVDKIVKSSHPEIGLQWIANLGLQDAVFHLPSQYSLPDGMEIPESKLAKSLPVWTEAIYTAESVQSLFASVLEDKTQLRLLWLLVGIYHWDGILIAANKHGRLTPATVLIIRDGLKGFASNEADLLAKIVLCSNNVQKVVTENQTTRLSRKDLGLLIRSCGAQWPLTFLFTLLREAVDSNIPFQELLPKYQTALSCIKAFDLASAWSLKSLLNGKALAVEFQLKTGPWMAPLLEHIVIWQLENPTGTAAECLDYVKANRSTLIKE